MWVSKACRVCAYHRLVGCVCVSKACRVCGCRKFVECVVSKACRVVLKGCRVCVRDEGL